MELSKDKGERGESLSTKINISSRRRVKLPAMKLIFKDERESLSTKKLSQEVEGWRFLQ